VREDSYAPRFRGGGGAGGSGHELILRAAHARCKLHVSRPLTRRRFVAGKPQDATIAIVARNPELIGSDSPVCSLGGPVCMTAKGWRATGEPGSRAGASGHAFTSHACGGNARRAAAAVRARLGRQLGSYA